jgi:hypothetical protein
MSHAMVSHLWLICVDTCGAAVVSLSLRGPLHSVESVFSNGRGANSDQRCAHHVVRFCTVIEQYDTCYNRALLLFYESCSL